MRTTTLLKIYVDDQFQRNMSFSHALLQGTKQSIPTEVAPIVKTIYTLPFK